MIAKEMKWNREVVGDRAEHVLFSNKISYRNKLI
jgi:hypothetical protein